MKQEAAVYGIVGALIGGAIVWFVANSAVNTSNVGIMRMMGMRGPVQQGQMQNAEVIDAHFIEQMIPHHEDAITMAKLAQQKAQTTEVQQLAEDIITSQGREIEQMKTWYKAWYGRELPTGDEVMMHHGMGGSAGMHMGMMGDATDIERLEKAENFDIVFAEEMIPHHQMAVMMASMLKNGTTRPEMRQLADNIIEAQTREIDQMREWLREWQGSQEN